MTLSRQESLHPSTQSTPGDSSTLDQTQLSRQPEDVTSNEKEPAGVTKAETKIPAEGSIKAVPELNADGQPETDAQVNEQIEAQANSQAHLAEDISQQPEDDDVDTPYEGFRHDEATIFNEFEAANKGDPIAEPLPAVWTDDIMLPPAYNATGVKSAYITPENKDDFASGVRNTDMWSRYKHHCLFLKPEEITIASLEIYKAQIAEIEGRDERRNKSGQHANQRAKPQTRNHYQGQQNHKDQTRRPDNRKRRFEDYQGEPRAESSRRDQAGDLTNFSHGYEAKRPKQMSPEPGEVSDSGSVQGSIRHERSAAEENGWTGWTRGPADIPPRNYPLPDRPTATDTHWYPEAANAHYQTQPPLKRHHTEGTFDGSYNSRRGRSRSPGDRRNFSNRRPHSPESNTRHRDVSSPHPGGTPNSNHRRRNDSNVSSAGREGRIREAQVTGISLSSSARPPQGRESPRSRSRVGRPRSRQSSPGNESEPESPGSPLTPLEAELLGLAGPDSSDSDTGGETTRRRPQKLVKMGKRKAPVVNAAFGLVVLESTVS
ncbi:uncharacterized protein PG998_003830 [Apiospora kogelbergensis]|uniref:uncharacterized protein n=1 Tax=Apiospora kogelbergensis TaxID=1337665 RepID=UPI00312E4A29